MAYRVIRRFARLLLAVFYRRIEMVGAERLPPSGPVIVAANHHNALVDGMLLLGTVPRRLVVLAKAPLFAHPLVGPFLRALGALPVHRRQEGGTDPARNAEMFRAVSACLARGGAVLIFPEGVSQPEPALMPLRTGAARMLLEAEAAADGGLGVSLVPVGLVFHEPGSFRTGWALVLVGEPVPARDCVRLYSAEPDRAVRLLTERIAASLRRLIVEAGDRGTLRLVRVAETIWRAEGAGEQADPAASAAWRSQVARAHRYLAARHPGRIAALRGGVERYAKALELSGLGDRALGRRAGIGVAVRYALREGLALGLGLPLALWGLASHGIPYNLTRAAVGLLRPDADVEATYKIAAAALIYPVCWAAEGGAAWCLGGGVWFTVFLLALLPTGFFALGWAERLDRAARETRSLLGFLLDRDLGRVLLRRRESIMRELQALLGLVPASVLEGRAEERG